MMLLDVPAAAPDLSAVALAALAKGGPFAALLVICVPLVEALKSWTQRRLPAAETPPAAAPVTISIDRETVRAVVETAHLPALQALTARVASIEERHEAEDRAAELAAAEARGAERALASRTTGDFAVVEPTDPNGRRRGR